MIDPRPEHTDEHATVAYPLDDLAHLAELLGEIDEFLRSRTDIIELLTVFMARRGRTHPGFQACNLIDDLSFTAHHIHCLVDDIVRQRS